MNSKTLSRTVVAAFLAAAFPFLLPVSAQQQGDPSETKVEVVQEVVTATGLKYQDLKAGEGTEAVSGKIVEVHYTGWLEESGKKFDSSVDRGKPFSFRLGAGQVIKGWDQGVAGMKVGGKRKLTIPSALGYGKTGAGEVIPPGATLVFEVELLGVR